MIWGWRKDLSDIAKEKKEEEEKEKDEKEQLHIEGND